MKNDDVFKYLRFYLKSYSMASADLKRKLKQHKDTPETLAVRLAKHNSNEDCY